MYPMSSLLIWLNNTSVPFKESDLDPYRDLRNLFITLVCFSSVMMRWSTLLSVFSTTHRVGKTLIFTDSYWCKEYLEIILSTDMPSTSMMSRNNTAPCTLFWVNYLTWPELNVFTRLTVTAVFSVIGSSETKSSPDKWITVEYAYPLFTVIS